MMVTQEFSFCEDAKVKYIYLDAFLIYLLIHMQHTD